MREGVDVVVIGGGVIGCAAAYALSDEGLRVVVLERDRVGAHASGGAAGILSSRDDVPGTPMDIINRASLALHPLYAERLREETRIDVEYQRAGSLTLLRSNEPEPEIRFDARRLDRRELLELEPEIGGEWKGAILHVDDGQVNADRLTHALAEGAARRGVSIRGGTPVTGFRRRGDAIAGVMTPDGEIEAEAVVLAAGPWSGILTRDLDLDLPIFPVKGEIVWAKSHPHVLNRPVFAGCYLVPKPEIGLAIGATYLRAGFDRTPTIGGALELLAAGVSAVPALRRAAFDRVWSSLRPGTPDGIPILGPVRSLRGLILATGHSAYGITLSLITGELVRNWVLERTQPFPTDAFSFDRFGAEVGS